MAGVWDNLMYQMKFNPRGLAQANLEAEVDAEGNPVVPTQENIMSSMPPAQAMPPPRGYSQPQSSAGAVSDPEFAALAKRTQEYPGFDPRRADIADMRSGLEKYLAQDQQVNLGPLAALVDAQTGSKFASSYQAPTSAEERQLTAAKLQAGIAREQAGLTDDEIKLLNSQLQAQQNKLLTGMKLDAATQVAAGKPSEGQIAEDRAFGKTLQEYRDAGGYSKAQKSLNLFSSVIDRLDKDPDLTGTPGHKLTPKAAMAKIYPNTAKAQQDAHTAVIGGLKAAFGGQLSDGEREAYFQTVWSTDLSPAQNKEKLQVALEEMQAAIAAKEDSAKYFVANKGSLSGYQGISPFKDKPSATKQTAGITVGQTFSDGKGGQVYYKGGDPKDPKNFSAQPIGPAPIPSSQMGAK